MYTYIYKYSFMFTYTIIKHLGAFTYIYIDMRKYKHNVVNFIVWYSMACYDWSINGFQNLIPV